MNPVSSFEKKIKKLFWYFVGRNLSAERVKPAKIKSVLALRPDRLGDFVLSVPALMALRDELGFSGQLTIVEGARREQLARFLFPEAKIWKFKKNIFSRISLCLRLWLNSFDAVVDFHSYPFSTTSSFMAVLSGAPIRVGFWAAGDFKEYEALSKKIFNFGEESPSENLPEVQKNLLLVHPLFPNLKSKPLKMNLDSFSPEMTAAVHDFYHQSGIAPGDKVLGIHPTLQKKDNRWSRDRYLELIQQLRSVKRLKIVVIHGKGEEDELERFQKKIGSFSNVFTLPNDDLFFILAAAKRFDGLVCNDSGMMHICAWVTPIFTIFGPSNAKRWGPQGSHGIRHQVFQEKDGLCDSVSAQKVALAVKKKLFHSR